ncbi:MAG: hypothetical protein CM1200mP12_11110 [Gammaproteobacteria bacterium]|nr:MAG: hypothetical protein CM1200mP12_11110 [Gammaproteobacteria bacterium]
MTINSTEAMVLIDAARTTEFCYGGIYVPHSSTDG